MFTACCLYHFIQSCNLLVNVNIVCVFITMVLKAWLISMPNQKQKHLDAFTQPANLNPIGPQQTESEIAVQCFRSAWLSKFDMAKLQQGQPNN